MKICSVRGPMVLIAAFCLFVFSGEVSAQQDQQRQAIPVDEGMNEIFRIGQARTERARRSQQTVDQLADETHDKFQDYRQVLKVIEGLRVYNERLEKQIENQERRIVEIEKATRDAAVVQRQIPAVVSRMIDGLEQFIDLDVPFHERERRDRILLLRVNQDRDNLTIAEKFRQVLEAYKIENEYGRKIDSYRDTVEIDGKPREVNILRIGRLALMYQTTDGELSGAWDQARRQWTPLGREFRTAILQGLRIARKQAAIELMKTPVPAPTAL